MSDLDDRLAALARLDPTRYDRSKGLFACSPTDPRFVLISLRRIERGQIAPLYSEGRAVTFTVAELVDAERRFGPIPTFRKPYRDGDDP